jgi:hypothetical protein
METELLGVKPAQVSLCLPKIPHRLALNGEAGDHLFFFLF